jgi:drug/metabolite transporter (DMT)-like permease
MILLGEKINLTGFVGLLITIGGVIWLTVSKKDAMEAIEHGFGRNWYGIVSSIIGAVCQGCGLVLSKLGFQKTASGFEISTLHAVWIRLLFAFTGAMIFALVIRTFKENSRTVFTNQNNGFRYMLAGTLLGPVAGVSMSLLAIQHLKVAEAQTVFALLPVFVLPLNYFIYREKITFTSICACLMAIAGVMILIWRDEIMLWI